jgi:hypothetical protein
MSESAIRWACDSTTTNYKQLTYTFSTSWPTANNNVVKRNKITTPTPTTTNAKHQSLYETKRYDWNSKWSCWY